MEQRGICLNDVEYPIRGTVQIERVTPYPDRFATGEISSHDYTPLMTQEWGPLTGGMGVEEWNSHEDDDRYWYAENVDCSSDTITLAPKITNNAGIGIGETINKIIYSQGLIWVIGTNDIAKWNGSTSTIAEPGTPLTAPTDAIVYYDTTLGECLVVAAGSQGVWETHDAGTTWTQRSTQNISYLAEYEGRLVGVGENTGFHYTAQGDIATAWTPQANYPNIPYTIKGLFSAIDPDDDPILYAVTTAGIWSLDVFSNFYQYKTELQWARDSSAGAAIYAKGDIYVAVGGMRLLKVRKGDVYEWGPDIDDGLPEDLHGTIKQIVCVGYWIVIVVEGDSSSIMKRHINGKGWHMLLVPGGSDCSCLCWDDGILYYPYLTNRLGSSTLSNKTDNYSYISTYEYINSVGYLYTHWFTSDFRTMVKVAHKLSLLAEDMGPAISGNAIQVHYKINSDDNSWTLLGTFWNTSEELNFDTNAEGVEFEKIKFRLGFNGVSGEELESPKLKKIVLRYSVFTPILYQWTVNIDALSKYAYSGQDLISSLKTALDTKTLLTFYPDGDKSSTAYYVRIVGMPRQEKLTERGQEAVYSLKLQEVCDNTPTPSQSPPD